MNDFIFSETITEHFPELDLVLFTPRYDRDYLNATGAYKENEPPCNPEAVEYECALTATWCDCHDEIIARVHTYGTIRPLVSLEDRSIFSGWFLRTFKPDYAKNRARYEFATREISDREVNSPALNDKHFNIFIHEDRADNVDFVNLVDNVFSDYLQKIQEGSNQIPHISITEADPPMLLLGCKRVSPTN